MPKANGKGRIERTTVNVPRPLYDALRQLIDEGKLPGGYVSVDEFVRDTLRERLRSLGYKV